MPWGLEEYHGLALVAVICIVNALDCCFLIQECFGALVQRLCSRCLVTVVLPAPVFAFVWRKVPAFFQIEWIRSIRIMSYNVACNYQSWICIMY